MSNSIHELVNVDFGRKSIRGSHYQNSDGRSRMVRQYLLEQNEFRRVSCTHSVYTLHFSEEEELKPTIDP